jgi:hypothetical protein
MKLKLPDSKGASPILSNRKKEMIRKSQHKEKLYPELVEGSRGYAKPYFFKEGLI